MFTFSYKFFALPKKIVVTKDWVTKKDSYEAIWDIGTKVINFEVKVKDENGVGDYISKTKSSMDSAEFHGNFFDTLLTCGDIMADEDKKKWSFFILLIQKISTSWSELSVSEKEKTSRVAFVDHFITPFKDQMDEHGIIVSHLVDVVHLASNS